MSGSDGRMARRGCGLSYNMRSSAVDKPTMPIALAYLQEGIVSLDRLFGELGQQRLHKQILGFFPNLVENWEKVAQPTGTLCLRLFMGSYWKAPIGSRCKGSLVLDLGPFGGISGRAEI